MSYIKQKRGEFRNEFPQLCPPGETVIPLDFSKIKHIEGKVAVKQCVEPVEEPVDYNALMRSTVQCMRLKWEKWNMDRDIYYDYDNYDDGLYYDSSESEEESLSAEDPEEWSD